MAINRKNVKWGRLRGRNVGKVEPWLSSRSWGMGGSYLGGICEE